MHPQRQHRAATKTQRGGDAPVLVVGSGIGGLVAAVVLAAQGCEVQVVERDAAPGGKLRPVGLAGQVLDAGPTVMTMRPVFDSLFELAGERLDQHLAMTPLRVLARHAWPDGSQLDLHASLTESVDAIGRFSGPQSAREYADFCARTRRVFESLDATYLRASRPDPVSLTLRCLRQGLPSLLGLAQGTPMQSLWRALGRQFSDPRLRQLFARYATYGGSSPMQAPATLMLIAHVEQAGVWSVAGGMHSLAQALVGLAQRLGVVLHCGHGVQRLLLSHGRISGLQLDDGRQLPASAVVFNGDAAALSAGLLGPEVQQALPGARQPLARRVARRSLSALTWNLVTPVEAAPLVRHNVYFSNDYEGEFDQLFKLGQLPQEPTVYVCAQDRSDDAVPVPGAPERLLCLVNAPARADSQPLRDEEIDACESRTFRHLARMGLALHPQRAHSLRHSPADWAARFPATGGALYGQATHGWTSSFTRPAAGTAVPGLYLAGGSTHPGAGVPMAALSGWRAAELCLAQRAGQTLTWPSLPVAMPGGTSMR